MRCTLRSGMLVLTALFAAHAPMAPAQEVNADGVRVLSEVPPPGVHPRVYFSAADLPDLRQRLTGTAVGRKIMERTAKLFEQNRGKLEALAHADVDQPTAELILEHIKPDEQRNNLWGMFAIDAVVRDDAPQKKLIAGVITSYAKLLMASKEMAVGGDLVGKTGQEFKQKLNVWKTDAFDVSVSWTLGASGMAVAYDLLYNDMTPAQRDAVRHAIAVGTAGRRSYGMGSPRGQAVSNHYGYHGDLLVLLTAIEGEEGYDQETYDNIKQVLVDYFEVGFTAAGACREDDYGPTLGLRAGSRGMLALARRGPNLFDTRQYKNYTDYFAQELEPFRTGQFVGGASGGPGLPYPTSVVVNKYMRPQDPVADYNWRYYIGDDYDRSFKWQGWLDIMLFGMDFDSSPSTPLTPELLGEAGLPDSVFYPERGKVIARSDWTPEAAYLHYDARPDAMFIGHDKVDRGNLVFDALGRNWVQQQDWHYFRESTGNSLLHIDGKAQAWKAPSVDMLAYADSGAAAVASADLKYAYDWQWSPPWPNKDKTFPSPWEHDTSDPRDLGFPVDHDWLPNTLYGTDEIGYVGSYMWRKPYNVVEKALRSTALVRGHHPYAVVYDDFKKDTKPHTYAFYLQLPLDVELKSHDGLDIVLGEVGEQAKGGQPAKGSRRLLVRVLEAHDAKGKPLAGVDAKIDDFNASLDGRNGPVPGRRLIVSFKSVEPQLKVMLLPVQVGEDLPTTTAAGDGQIDVSWADQKDTLTFSKAAEGRPAITVKQNLTARSTPVLPVVVSNAAAAGKSGAAAVPVATALKPQDAPVATYGFDDISGGKTGTPPATIHGATPVEGKEGQALRFDGKGAHVSLPTGLGSTHAGSVSFWLRADEPTGQMAMILVGSPARKSGGNGGHNEAAFFLSNRGNITLGIGGTSVKGPKVTDGRWHRVQGTWEAGGQLTLTLDGRQVDQKDFAPDSFEWTGHTTLGKPGADQRYFKGDLDQVVIHNRNLDAPQERAPQEPE